MHRAVVFVIYSILVFSIAYSRRNVRTKISVNVDMMAEALAVSGFRTNRETIEQALRLLIQMKTQEGIRQFRGRLLWQGDLDKIRADS